MGGSDVWEKFPNNVVFFFDSVPKVKSFTLQSGIENTAEESENQVTGFK